jgi:hypothetical protein
LSPADLIGGPLHLDHILPESLGGTTDIENLALACSRCNLHKASRRRAVDPVSGAVVPLFHPRRQRWSRHFRWAVGGTHVQGRTRSGRATVAALAMNDTTIVAARLVWVAAGLHPDPQAYRGR